MTDPGSSPHPAVNRAEAADLFRRAPERWIGVNDSEVAYRRVGQGPDVLFVHGWPASGATFRLLLPHLADQVTCHLIDLPGAGDSRFDEQSPLSVEHHIDSVKTVVGALGLDELAVVGHNSGGMIARHALVGDHRLRAMALINTEQPQGLGWRFKAFLAARNVPRFGQLLGWAAGRPVLRRNPFILGDAFHDASLLDGEFDEFFLQPLYRSPKHQKAAVRILRSFKQEHVEQLGAIHQRIHVPVRLVWGEEDPSFPVARAKEMVDTFPDAAITTVANAGLFAHEERPAEVAAAMLPVLSHHPAS